MYQENSRSLAIFLVAAALSACGSASFDDGSTGKQNGNATRTPGYTGQKVDKLTWFWQCDSAPDTAPKTNGGDVVIYGGGDHRFKSGSFDKTPLIFSGKVCPPITYPRDIVFVVDVSGSMGGFNGNDPKKGSGSSFTCGRLQAVQAIVDDITSRGGDSRFAVVTFSTVVVAKSSTMFGDRVNLFADISQGSNIANTLCAAGGNTNYGTGLSAAESILNGSRVGAMKEIYFVSDGEPTDSDGPAIAQRLKSPGVLIGGKPTPVTIATAMIGSGDDTQLRTNIASIDASGKPLHAGSVQAGDLARTLSNLAANEIIDGKMRYRPIGTDPWQEISLIQNMKAYSFTVPPITIDRSSAPNGLDVLFEYRDQHNNIYSSQGKISWSDTNEKAN